MRALKLKLCHQSEILQKEINKSNNVEVFRDLNLNISDVFCKISVTDKGLKASSGHVVWVATFLITIHRGLGAINWVWGYRDPSRIQRKFFRKVEFWGQYFLQSLLIMAITKICRSGPITLQETCEVWLYRPDYAEILRHSPRFMLGKGLKPLVKAAAYSFP